MYNRANIDFMYGGTDISLTPEDMAGDSEPAVTA